MSSNTLKKDMDAVIKIYDILYCGDRATQDSVRITVSEHFPDATFVPTCDYIHGYRLGVCLQVSLADWFVFILSEQLHDLSFYFQLYLLDSPRLLLPCFDRAKQLARTKEGNSGQTGT